MPSKNVVKKYIPGGVYHIYNRGIEKKDIFLDEEDYKIFLYYLKSYLLPSDHPDHKKLPYTLIYGSDNFNLFNKIKLFAYCLMPNHFHLMLKQVDKNSVIEFMKRLSNAYTKYFNKKYKRIGSLFQGRYKAVIIDREEYFLHLSRYIHRNPLELLDEAENLINYPYSSYPAYLNKQQINWLNCGPILQYFKNFVNNKLIESWDFLSYRDFVERYKKDAQIVDLKLD